MKKLDKEDQVARRESKEDKEKGVAIGQEGKER